MRVSRAALDDSDDNEPEDEEEESGEDSESSEEDSEEFDDPDTADLERDNIIDDEEIDSDEAFESGEEEIFKSKGFTFKDSKSAVNGSAKVVANGRPKRMVAADLMSESESEGQEDDEGESGVDGESDDDDAGAQLDGSGSEEDESDDDESLSQDYDSNDGSDEDESEEEDREMGGMDTGDDHSNMRNLVQSEQKVISNISQAAKAEAEKGVAVRQQRRTYDSLLNLRIRLQKGLVAINSMGEAADAEDSDKKPYEAAEEAAIKLWTAIDGFRASLLPEQKAGQKRKRDIDTSASNEEIWDDMQATEERAAAKRNKILDKWSSKVKSTTATVNREWHLGTTASQSLVSALEMQLLNSERLVRRTHVPRSCAPLQAATKVAEDPEIFDDADFYQLLLKELVDQRTNDAGSGDANGSVPTVRWTAIKEAKTRKQVDRRASKGRKLRFTVHEKLQNFMAPEDRRNWEDDAIDRLFGTLFGQRMQLKEDVSEDDEDDMAVAEEGLKLFRS